MFFGLRPKGFNFTNNVRWLPGRSGLHFEKYSIAYTKLDKIQEEKNWQGKGIFSTEIAIEPEVIDSGEFRVILSFYGGEERDQIIIGQWRSYIIIMSGDDYAHKNKTWRFEAKMAVSILEPVFISLTSGQNGANLYINGQLVKSLEDPVVLPNGEHMQLTLANSVYGQHSWQGNILGASFYAHELNPESIKSHFNRWAITKKFDTGNDANPMLNYLFDEKDGAVVVNNAGMNYPLIIPAWMHLFKKTVLANPLTGFEFNRCFIGDVIINFIGFMPLGFCLCAIFVAFGKSNRTQAILLSTGLCFMISLGIEIAQAWIPSRSSQLMDVLMNTLGALAGAKIENIKQLRAVTKAML